MFVVFNGDPYAMIIYGNISRSCSHSVFTSTKTLFIANQLRLVCSQAFMQLASGNDKIVIDIYNANGPSG